jgi:putative ABC transport system permease protein
MNVSRKLALAYARRHPARMLLTSLATIASACVVVWVVSGYDALVGQFGNKAAEYLGRYDLFLVPDSAQDSVLPAELIEAMHKDAAIAEWEPALQWSVRVKTEKAVDIDASSKGSSSSAQGAGQSGQPQGAPPERPKLVGTNSATPPYPLVQGRWIDTHDAALREAVISDQSAEQLHVGLGDEVLVILGTKEYRLTLVGIVAQAFSAPTSEKTSESGRPLMAASGTTLGPAAAALYVPFALAEKITRQTGKINLVNIKLRPGEQAAFRARWLPQVLQTKPPVILVGVQDIQNAMAEATIATNARRQAWAATCMSLLAALFIIFTTLSMGVVERVRQFAIMRAIGLTQSQVARVIAAESLVMALIGWAGGLIAGWGLLAVASYAKPGLFNHPSLGGWCVLLAGVAALGGALAASILPAWQATRVQPLEAMSPRRQVPPALRTWVITGAIGAVLMALNPLLVYCVPAANAPLYGTCAALGFTSMVIGLLLIAPLTVIVTEAAVGPWLARAIRLEPRLLRAQLSSNLWRTLGTALAMSVGLGLYVSMMIWGYSMLQPFKPGDWVPDMLVTLQSGGLPDAEIDTVRHLPGIIPEQCVPLAVEQPRLAGDITDSEKGNSVTRQDNILMIGLDPQTAFGGSRSLVGAKFVQGGREQAIARLKQGRFCIVPDHFLTATGLKLGDHFDLVPPDMPDKPVQYTIAGVVELPGWHWIAQVSGLRRRGIRSAAMVFASYDNVRRDFDIRDTNYLWMNVKPGADVPQIGAELQPLADRYLGPGTVINVRGPSSFGATKFGQSLRITTPDDVRTQLLARADDVIWAMCELPLITLLVTSLGVVNTIVASVRARRWELGVLRALGVTRWGLARMILAEGLLIGLVACILSLSFGVMAGWCATGVSQNASFFGGLATPLVVPWGQLAAALSATLGLCLAASLWPAIRIGRTEPLQLLREGRSAM